MGRSRGLLGYPNEWRKESHRTAHGQVGSASESNDSRPNETVRAHENALRRARDSAANREKLRRTRRGSGEGKGACRGESAQERDRARCTRNWRLLPTPPTFARATSWSWTALNNIERLFDVLQAVDGAPTPQQKAAVTNLQRDAQSARERWKAIPQEVAGLNTRLEAAGLEKIKFP